MVIHYVQWTLRTAHNHKHKHTLVRCPCDIIYVSTASLLVLYFSKLNGMELNWTQISRMTVQNKTQAKTEMRVLMTLKAPLLKNSNLQIVGRSQLAKMGNENTIRNNFSTVFHTTDNAKNIAHCDRGGDTVTCLATNV